MIRRSYLVFFDTIHFIIPDPGVLRVRKLGELVVITLRCIHDFMMDWLMAVPGPLDDDIMVILLGVLFLACSQFCRMQALYCNLDMQNAFPPS